MDARTLFDLCRNREDQIGKLEDAIESLEAQMTSCSSGMGETIRGMMGDRYAAYVARKEGLEKELKLLKRKRATEQVAVILLTDRMPAARRDALRLYYGRGHGAAQVAIVLNYSLRHVERLLGEERARLDEIPRERVAAVLPHWYLQMAKEEGWDA